MAVFRIKKTQNYEGDDYSGTNFNRSGFQRMLADVKAGKISRVIVEDMSRLGRDYLQVGIVPSYCKGARMSLPICAATIPTRRYFLPEIHPTTFSPRFE